MKNFRSLRYRGSSPLARGLHPWWTGGRSRQGIIPARAGFTRPDNGSAPAVPDHPRSRGVYRYSVPEKITFLGSSPLARGLRRIVLPRNKSHRIIPARAGFTMMRSPGPKTAPDHPRSRGVYGDACSAQEADGGSSPLARGLPPQPSDPTRRRGIIPARAGFTGAAQFA